MTSRLITHQESGIYADFVDVQDLPLTALRTGRCGALRESLGHVLRQTDEARVCDQDMSNVWTG